ncbi:MAG: hypothetical protein K2M75_02110 [Clostridia bacterium]|nr:hypothetical protein [Clostridia bacterium]
MVKALFGALVVFLVIIIILLCVGYWFFNYTTLEKLGYADVEIAQTEMPNGEKVSITPRSIGIENMTMKELFDWFKDRLKSGKTAKQ